MLLSQIDHVYHSNILFGLSLFSACEWCFIKFIIIIIIIKYSIADFSKVCMFLK